MKFKMNALLILSCGLLAACGQAKFGTKASSFATLSNGEVSEINSDLAESDSNSQDSSSIDSDSQDTGDCSCCLSSGQGHGTLVVVPEGTAVPVGAKLRSAGRLCLPDAKVTDFLSANPEAQSCGENVAPPPVSGTGA